jgi:hypothetical protein
MTVNALRVLVSEKRILDTAVKALRKALAKARKTKAKQDCTRRVVTREIACVNCGRLL